MEEDDEKSTTQEEISDMRTRLSKMVDNLAHTTTASGKRYLGRGISKLKTELAHADNVVDHLMGEDTFKLGRVNFHIKDLRKISGKINKTKRKGETKVDMKLGTKKQEYANYIAKYLQDNRQKTDETMDTRRVEKAYCCYY